METRERTIEERVRALDLDGLIKVNEQTGCWDWQGRTNAKGYALVDVLRADGTRTTRRAHRMVWEAYQDQDAPPGLDAFHTCDRTVCVRPLHIAWSTKATNNDDRIMRGNGVGRHAVEIAS